DQIAPPARFQELVAERARTLAAESDRSSSTEGVTLGSLERSIDETGYHYRWVAVDIDADQRFATLTVTGPSSDELPVTLTEIVAAGAGWWPLTVARELDDALLMLRANNHEIGAWVLKTLGEPDAVLACDATMAAHRDNWFVRETIGLLRRTLQRLEISSRSLFAVIDEGSCFAGSLFELALASDRS